MFNIGGVLVLVILAFGQRERAAALGDLLSRLDQRLRPHTQLLVALLIVLAVGILIYCTERSIVVCPPCNLENWVELALFSMAVTALIAVALAILAVVALIPLVRYLLRLPASIVIPVAALFALAPTIAIHLGEGVSEPCRPQCPRMETALCTDGWSGPTPPPRPPRAQCE
jgi:hypothetical protein